MEKLLNALRTGQITRSDLQGLSNLSREQAEVAWGVCRHLPAETRREIVWALVEIAENDFELNFDEVFCLAMEDEDAGVRHAAIEGLWEDEDIRLVPRLVARLLEDPAAEVRAAAATSLGRFLLLGELGKIQPHPHQQAFQALLTVHTSRSEGIEVRRRALESLAYSCEETVAELIRAAYEDPDEQMRVSAVFAMGRSADERWAPEVMRELHSSNPEMRYEAARACGELALEEAVPALIELVEDVDPEVQEAAIWALGQVGGDEARRVLRACTRSENEAVQEAAREALLELEFLHGDLGTFLLFDFLEGDEEDEEEGEDEEEALW